MRLSPRRVAIPLAIVAGFLGWQAWRARSVPDALAGLDEAPTLRIESARGSAIRSVLLLRKDPRAARLTELLRGLAPTSDPFVVGDPDATIAWGDRRLSLDFAGDRAGVSAGGAARPGLALGGQGRELRTFLRSLLPEARF